MRNLEGFIQEKLFGDNKALKEIEEKLKSQAEKSRIVDEGLVFVEVMKDKEVGILNKAIPLGIATFAATKLFDAEGPIPDNVKFFGKIDNVFLAAAALALGAYATEKFAGKKAIDRARTKITSNP